MINADLNRRGASGAFLKRAGALASFFLRRPPPRGAGGAAAAAAGAGAEADGGIIPGIPMAANGIIIAAAAAALGGIIPGMAKYAAAAAAEGTKMMMTVKGVGTERGEREGREDGSRISRG